MLIAVPHSPLRTCLVLLLCASVTTVAGFVVTEPQKLKAAVSSVSAFPIRRHHHHNFPPVVRFSAESTTEEDETTIASSYDALFSRETPDYEIQNFELLPHRPLGCTVEESLADSQFVFVSRVSEGGYADQAGLKVGDTLLQVSGIFGELTPVVGIGVEKLYVRHKFPLICEH